MENVNLVQTTFRLKTDILKVTITKVSTVEKICLFVATFILAPTIIGIIPLAIYVALRDIKILKLGDDGWFNGWFLERKVEIDEPFNVDPKTRTITGHTLELKHSRARFHVTNLRFFIKMSEEEVLLHKS